MYIGGESEVGVQTLYITTPFGASHGCLPFPLKPHSSWIRDPQSLRHGDTIRRGRSIINRCIDPLRPLAGSLLPTTAYAPTAKSIPNTTLLAILRQQPIRGRSLSPLLQPGQTSRHILRHTYVRIAHSRVKRLGQKLGESCRASFG